MQVKLRQVGNSVGVTIPASELKTHKAAVGDTVEMEIKHVVRHPRAGWDNPDLWSGASDEPLLLEGAPEPSLDDEGWE